MKEALTLKKIRKKYASRFPDFDLHHMVPRSRNGSGSEFNLFPYDERAHSDYHFLFWNLRIDQVWDMLGQIHNSIFESEKNYTTQWWLEHCELDKGTVKHKQEFEKRKQDRLVKPVSVRLLQVNWIGIFGGPDLITAEEFLKLMMLFMVFGTKTIDANTLFNNGNLIEFFEDSPCNSGDRLWAFEICFGNGGTTHGMKSKIASILNRHRNYSL